MRVSAEKDVFLFAGPTLAASARATAMARKIGLRKRPPVRRRSVEELIAKTKTPGVLVLVDGLFHDTLAVGHAEIREALAAGWSVWGLSSMGAIRAREMAHLGMRGFGEVFERFMQPGDFQDDEVALLHAPTPPYRAISEPLVHLRAAIAHVVNHGLVDASSGDEVIADLKSRWYGERTVRGTVVALAARARSAQAAEAIRTELRDFSRFALKSRDLDRFLEAQPWQRMPTSTSTPPALSARVAAPCR